MERTLNIPAETRKKHRFPKKFFIIMIALALAAVGAGAAGPAIVEETDILSEEGITSTPKKASHPP